MTKKTIATDLVPAAIGPYSQAVSVAGAVYLSGQIPLDPKTMTLVEGGFEEQARQVLMNLSALANASGGSLGQAVKLTVYVTDLANFDLLNKLMEEFIPQPFPARAAAQVSALPKGAMVEIDAILSL